MKQMPFFLIGGYETKPFPLPFQETSISCVEQRLVHLQKARDKALAALELAQQ
jgi:hypothetical protein